MTRKSNTEKQVRIGSTPIGYICRLAACNVSSMSRAVARVLWKNDGGYIERSEEKWKSNGSLHYGEAVELADVLGYDIVWQKRRK